MRRRLQIGVIALGCFLASGLAHAQKPASTGADEIPIEKCDVLPVVQVKIDGTAMRFLLDTGATTVLNLESFASGRSKAIEVTSWSGTAETSAREVRVPEMQLGTHQLHDLRLPAIDLKPLSKACGKRIDGILGVDLLDRMGVTINLQRQVASLGPEVVDARKLYDLMETGMHHCSTAFEQGDAKSMEACFDPEIVLYTPDGEFSGRSQVMEYLKERYMKYAPELCYRYTLKDVKSFGDVLWYSYEYTLDSPKEHQIGHGMSICRREQGAWRILSMHNSMRERDAAGQ